MLIEWVLGIVLSAVATTAIVLVDSRDAAYERNAQAVQAVMEVTEMDPMTAVNAVNACMGIQEGMPIARLLWLEESEWKRCEIEAAKTPTE